MALVFDDPSLVYDVKAPLLIEASAGSGKTTILTERWVAVLVYLLVWEQKEPSEALGAVAALTFSRKAAAEMKERIRIRMDELFSEGGFSALLDNLQAYQGLRISKAEAEAQLAAQREELDDLISSAQITTIDAFISRSLRQNPLELGEERGSEPEEGNGSMQLIQTEVLRSCISGRASKALGEAFSAGVALCGFSRWTKLLQELCVQAEIWGQEGLRQLLEASNLLRWQPSEGIYAQFLQTPLNNLIARLREEQAHKALSQSNGDLLATLDTIDGENFMVLFKKNLSGSYALTEVKDDTLNGLRLACNGASLDLSEALTAVMMPLMMPVVDECARRLAEYRLSQGLTTFAESERLFLSALRKGPMAEKLQSRIRFFLADEFQDTSSAQKEIFSFIAKQAVVFYVGDPKQSIFRFRGSRVSIFKETAEEFRSQGWKVAVLRANYRSGAGHVSFVNGIFARVFAGDPDITYTPQEAARADTPCRQGYSLLGGETSSEERERTFADALAIIRKERLRGLDPGDILILFRNNRGIRDFYAYLKNMAPDLSVSSSEREGLFNNPYIVPLLSFLRAADNPADELNIAVALKTLFFRKDDIEINALLQESRSRNIPLLQALAPADREFIQSYARRKDRLPLEELVSIFLGETAYEAVLAEEPGEALASLRLFQEELQTLYLTQNLSLGEFLTMVDENTRKTSEAEVSGGEGKSIRLMTMHKSKGLESPCVIYVHRDAQILKNLSYPLVHGGRIAFNFFGTTRLSEEFREIERAESFADEKRLAYVALTRAKQVFHLCGLPEEKESRDTLYLGHVLHRGLFTSCERLEDLPAEPPKPEGRSSRPPAAARFAELRNLEKHYPRLPQSLSVSQLLDAEFSTLGISMPSMDLRDIGGGAPSPSFDLRDIGGGDFSLRMPSPMDIGTMVHSVLQQFDAASEAEVLGYLSSYFPEYQEGFGQVAASVQGYWQSPLFQSLILSPERHKERRVQMLLPEGILIRAAADLYADGNSKIIVDYKLSLGNKLARYRRQLSYYALISDRAGYPVDELILFDLGQKEAHRFGWDKNETEAAFADALQKFLRFLSSRDLA